MTPFANLFPSPLKSRLRSLLAPVAPASSPADQASSGPARDETTAWQRRMEGAASGEEIPEANPLEAFFDARVSGRGIWKWRHYFEIYHRHFSRFVDKDVCVLEIGVYSGGSLDMWKHYFGPRVKIYGVDIEPSCKAYEDDQVKIFIGDQADPEFWRSFKREVPHLDIIIDDGGHEPQQQIVTLEELFPHLRPGGVYLCEDITGKDNLFAAYLGRLATHLHSYAWQADHEDPERRLQSPPTSFQRTVHAMHLYPFVAVMERARYPVDLVAPKHGTQWQPFLS